MHILLVLLLVLLIAGIVGAFPRWPHSSNWGYGPSGIGGILLLVFVVWLLFFGGLAYLR